jgi:chromosome segregation ATPase
MKHVLIAAILMSTLMTGVAYAENSADDTGFDDKNLRQERQEKTEDRRDDMIEKQEERRETFQERTTERREVMKERFDEFKKQRIGTLIGVMARRMNWAIERLENIAGRIDTRIDTLEEHGVDMTDAKTHLANAREHITNAQDLLGDINTDVDTLVADETTANDKFAAVREIFAKIKEEIKAAWSDLRSALEAIKVSQQNDDDSDKDNE